MCIMSWNVQGFGGHLHRKIKGWFPQEIQPCLVGGLTDVIMLQEHHLNRQTFQEFVPPLMRNWECYWSSSLGPHVVQGGTCILINGKIKHYIIENKILI